MCIRDRLISYRLISDSSFIALRTPSILSLIHILQLGWIQQRCYLVVDTCTNHLAEMEKYSWNEDKDVPEDRNDHTINAQQYGWIPYRQMIGFETEEQRR